MIRLKNNEVSRQQERIAEINSQNRNYHFSSRPSLDKDDLVEIETQVE